MTTTKRGKVWGYNVQVGDVWLRDENTRIVIDTVKAMNDGGTLVNGCWRFVPVDRYRIERTYS